jgi:hypothetical protein
VLLAPLLSRLGVSLDGSDNELGDGLGPQVPEKGWGEGRGWGLVGGTTPPASQAIQTRPVFTGLSWIPFYFSHTFLATKRSVIKIVFFHPLYKAHRPWAITRGLNVILFRYDARLIIISVTHELKPALY